RVADARGELARASGALRPQLLKGRLDRATDRLQAVWRLAQSVNPENLEAVRSRLTSVPFSVLGKVTGDELRIRVAEEDFRWPIAELHDLWFNSIAQIMESDASES
ncbi:MAG: hypothetical protein ACJ8HQ_05175, partial [Chthoniobacterales bacterium]